MARKSLAIPGRGALSGIFMTIRSAFRAVFGPKPCRNPRCSVMRRVPLPEGVGLPVNSSSLKAARFFWTKSTEMVFLFRLSSSGCCRKRRWSGWEAVKPSPYLPPIGIPAWHAGRCLPGGTLSQTQRIPFKMADPERASFGAFSPEIRQVQEPAIFNKILQYCE